MLDKYLYAEKDKNRAANQCRTGTQPGFAYFADSDTKSGNQKCRHTYNESGCKNTEGRPGGHKRHALAAKGDPNGKCVNTGGNGKFYDFAEGDCGGLRLWLA